MRPRIVIAAILMAVAIVAAVMVMGPKPNAPAPLPVDGAGSGAPAAAQQGDGGGGGSATESARVAASSAPAPYRPAMTTPPTATSSDPYKSDATMEAEEEIVNNRVNEVLDLGSSDDPNAMNTIVNELSNPEPRIRAAAVTAVQQLQNPDAIPQLKAAMAQTDDGEEKIRIQKAINFLAVYQPPPAEDKTTQ